MFEIEALSRAIVRVGEGRGFLVARTDGTTAIITAAHCLPHLPPPHGFSHAAERTYQRLVGEIGAPPTICVECLFVNPVADLAVLVEPDGQALFDEWRAFDVFVEDRPRFRLDRIPPDEPVDGWLYAKNCKWTQMR